MVIVQKSEIKSLQSSLLAAFGILLLGIILGFYTLDIPIETIQRLADPVRHFEATNQPWRIFGYILQHNTVSTLINVLGGYLAIFSLVSNGVLIGVVVKLLVPHISPGCMAASLLPHGVIEIPAVILSASLGLAFATRLAKAFMVLPKKGYFLANPAELLSAFSTNKAVQNQAKLTLRLYIFVVAPALITAALLETFLTPIIMRSQCLF